MPELWWRAEDKRYADYDPWAEWEQPSSSHLKIIFRSFTVIKHTPQGVWLREFWEPPRFVLGTSIKQFAVPTKELALQDLIQRKLCHVAGARARLAHAEEHLEGARRELSLLVSDRRP